MIPNRYLSWSSLHITIIGLYSETSSCIMFHSAIEWVQERPSRFSVGLPRPLVLLSVVAAALGVEFPARPRRFADWTSAWNLSDGHGEIHGDNQHGDDGSCLSHAESSGIISCILVNFGWRETHVGNRAMKHRLTRPLKMHTQCVKSVESLGRRNASRNSEYLCWRWTPVSLLIPNFQWSVKAKHLISSKNQTLDCRRSTSSQKWCTYADPNL